MGLSAATPSLTAEVATSYFTVLQYTRDLRIARQSYVLRRESAALVDSLARYGMSNGVALQQAMSLVYQAEADIRSISVPSSSRVWPSVSCSGAIPPISGTKLSTMPCWTIIR